MRGIDIARCIRSMCRVLVEVPETNIHRCIRAFQWHHNGELLNQATCIRRGNFAKRAGLVAFDFLVCVDRQRRDVIAFSQNGLRAFDVMEVRIDDCCNRRISHLAQTTQRLAHFLNGFTCINCDDAFRRLNE